MTLRVKEHEGTLVKTLYVSLHCRHSTLFEGGFFYNNNLNQSLGQLFNRSTKSYVI